MKIDSQRSGLRAFGLAAAAAITALTAGCGNGLVSTGQPTGAAPSQSSTAPAPSVTPSPSESATTSASSTSTSATPSASETAGSSNASSSGGATSSSPSTSSGGGSGATRATCTLDDLAVGVRSSPGGGAAGSNYVLLTFRNTSGSTCYLRGYAGVTFVGKQNGTQLGHAATRVRGRELATVKLSAGETETELLQIANAGNFDANDCAPTTSDGFRVYPPAETKAAYVPFRTEACQKDGVQQLSVYPVGTSG